VQKRELKMRGQFEAEKRGLFGRNIQSEKGKDGTTHSHLLIETNDKKGVKRSLDPLKKWSHVHCVDVCPLIQENGVLRLGEYLAKSIDEDIDYDILIND
jgi:hypothetical protein